MGIAMTIAGLVVIGLGLLDMFHSLLHPRGKGAISHAVISTIWTVSRRLGHRFGSAVGPVGMVAAVLVWVVLQGLGWALVFLPHIPQGFTYSPGIDPARYQDFAEALYISWTRPGTRTLQRPSTSPSSPWPPWGSAMWSPSTRGSGWPHHFRR
ncbi:hypothetical protein [Citricoccus nitrophenolicus]|uniref:hypothetical protein n=1 Tax=Citricoccus nitrophenolicus TaxID=863575 RepID=UPI00337D36BA